MATRDNGAASIAATSGISFLGELTYVWAPLGSRMACEHAALRTPRRASPVHGGRYGRCGADLERLPGDDVRSS
jgi:hypothetical protein